MSDKEQYGDMEDSTELDDFFCQRCNRLVDLPKYDGPNEYYETTNLHGRVCPRCNTQLCNDCGQFTMSNFRHSLLCKDCYEEEIEEAERDEKLMNKFDQIASIAKNITPKTVQGVSKFYSSMNYLNAWINKFSSDPFYRLNNVMKTAIPTISTLYNNPFKYIYDTVNVGMPAIDSISKLYGDFLNLTKTTIPTIALVNSNTYKSIFDAVNVGMPAVDSISKLYDDFQIFTKVAMPRISTINLETISSFNYFVNQKIDEILVKNEYDDDDIERVTELSNFTLGMTFTGNCPNTIKKNLLKNFLRNIWRLMGIPQFAVILAIIIPLVSYAISKYESSNISKTMKEIIIIEREYREQNLRGIIYDSTRIYIKPHTKSLTLYTLDRGDIVEALKLNKKWVYVRLYKTDIEGWVLKKYTKGTK
jgi:hypothetical protein